MRKVMICVLATASIVGAAVAEQVAEVTVETMPPVVSRSG